MKSDSYARMVNKQHFNRIKSLLERTQGKVLMGGGLDEEERKIEPTVVVSRFLTPSLGSEIDFLTACEAG